MAAGRLLALLHLQRLSVVPPTEDCKSSKVSTVVAPAPPVIDAKISETKRSEVVRLLTATTAATAAGQAKIDPSLSI